MDWSVDFIDDASKENLKLVRDTLDAKHNAESGNYGDAARILWEIIIEARHSKNKKWECMTMVHMGKVYRVLRWSIAVKLLEEAVELASAIGFTKARMMALNDLGEMHCSWGQLQSSIKYLEESLSLVDKEDKESMRAVLLNLVVANEGLGNYAKCKEYLARIISLDREIGSPEIDEDMDHLDSIEERLAESDESSLGHGSKHDDIADTK
ncbi:MAG: hypothetical protein GXP49_15495 [Deltaproteobacteria bacterium]|nr:hypothetical protein [Deltaproteobacteria bacterium]